MKTTADCYKGGKGEHCMHCPNERLMNHVLVSKIQIVGGMHHLSLLCNPEDDESRKL
jgi:7-cyano-7-deazaguanine synthase in queuosine biosynthesis